MDTFDSNVHADTASALVPIVSNPLFSGDPLAPKPLFSCPDHGPEAMPIIPERSNLMLGVQKGDRQVDSSEERAKAFFQPLATELAPIYPELAKALTKPIVDEVIQSGSDLLARRLQVVEDAIQSGKLMASDTTHEVSRSARELFDEVRGRWRAPDNSFRNELDYQAKTAIDSAKQWLAEADDSEWMATVRRRLASAREQVDVWSDRAFNLLGYLGGSSASEREAAALARAEARLKKTMLDLRESPDFVETLETAFGDDWEPAITEATINKFLDEQTGPEIKVVDALTLPGAGAYGNNTIFVSDEIVGESIHNPDLLDTVLLEETGHYLDQQLNDTDSLGDEGDIFARLVENETLSQAELLQLRNERDHTQLTLDGEVISVENRLDAGHQTSRSVSAPVNSSDRRLHIQAGTQKQFDKAYAAQRKSSKRSAPVNGSDRHLHIQAGTEDKFDKLYAAQNKGDRSSAHSRRSSNGLISYQSSASMMSGKRIRRWQREMNRQGYNIKVDGIFGPQSQQIAKQFQRKNKLDADGIIGPKTWAASFSKRKSSQPGSRSKTDQPTSENPRQADALAGWTSRPRPKNPRQADAQSKSARRILKDVHERVENAKSKENARERPSISAVDYRDRSYDALYRREYSRALENLENNPRSAHVTWNYDYISSWNGVNSARIPDSTSTGAKEMLQENKAFLKKAAERYRIDGRAIAGAIRWEYEQNTFSRKLDGASYDIVQATGSTERSPARGNGWGKVHYDVARKILRDAGKPISDDRTLAKKLALPPSSIDLIAREMGHAADVYEHAGKDIRDKPEILAALYQIGEDGESYEEKAAKPKPPGIGESKMGKWVQENESSLEPYGTP